MKESYYIEAAMHLGIIVKYDNSGAFIPYGLSSDSTHITYEGGSIHITPEIESKAIYLNKLYEIRKIRNSFLSNTDWTVLPDVSMDETEKQKWLLYRQSLRDCTNLLIEGSEDNFEFPAYPD